MEILQTLYQERYLLLYAESTHLLKPFSDFYNNSKLRSVPSPNPCLHPTVSNILSTLLSQHSATKDKSSSQLFPNKSLNSKAKETKDHHTPSNNHPMRDTALQHALDNPSTKRISQSFSLNHPNCLRSVKGWLRKILITWSKLTWMENLLFLMTILQRRKEEIEKKAFLRHLLNFKLF